MTTYLFTQTLRRVATLKNRMRDQLAARFPELVTDVAVCELSGPLAFRHHLNAIDGGLYGAAQTPTQSMKNRFSSVGGSCGPALAGQGVFGGGVGPCIVSGRVASRVIAERLS